MSHVPLSRAIKAGLADEPSRPSRRINADPADESEQAQQMNQSSPANGSKLAQLMRVETTLAVIPHMSGTVTMMLTGITCVQ